MTDETKKLVTECLIEVGELLNKVAELQEKLEPKDSERLVSQETTEQPMMGEQEIEIRYIEAVLRDNMNWTDHQE